MLEEHAVEGTGADVWGPEVVAIKKSVERAHEALQLDPDFAFLYPCSTWETDFHG